MSVKQSRSSAALCVDTALARELAALRATVRGRALRGGRVHEEDARKRCMLTMFDVPACPRAPDVRLRVVRLGTDGDGSCFFHSYCLATNHRGYRELYKNNQLKECQRIALDFRCALGRVSQKEWRDFIASEERFTPQAGPLRDWFEREKRRTAPELSERFCSLRTWADEPMIRFCARKMQKNIMSFDVMMQRFYCHLHGLVDHQPLVLIAWVEHRHFETGALELTHPGGRRELRTELRHGDPIDRWAIAHMVDTYARACPTALPARARARALDLPLPR